jgi:hypothetical protein
MLNTVKAIVREGRIELLERVDIPEGTEVVGHNTFRRSRVLLAG